MKTAPALLLAAGLAAVASVDAQSLLYEFRFNNPSENTTSASSAPPASSANFTNFVTEGDIARQAANLYGPNQSGASGLVGDYAFDNSASTRMGGSGAVNGANTGYGGMAQVTNGSNALNGATSFTVQGWYNGATAPGNYARLIEIGTFGIWFQGDALQVSARINESSGTAQILSSADATMRQANVWTFFAFTYDGVTGTASLYGGSTTGSVSLLATGTFLTGTLATNTNQALTIGNSSGNNNQRPFDGLLDNFRVWGETEGSDGALSLADLEAVRLADVSNSPIPEPSAFAALAGLGALAWGAARRRRH